MSERIAMPWMKWDPVAHANEPTLKLCAPITRVLWDQILALMHQATPYGHLLVQGQKPSPADLAAISGLRENDVIKGIAELVAKKVCDVRDGVLVSRRCERDYAKYVQDKTNGGKGGNPRLKRGVNPPDNAPDNPGVNQGVRWGVKARGKKEESDEPLKGSSDLRASAPAPDKGAGASLAWVSGYERWAAFMPIVPRGDQHWFGHAHPNGSDTTLIVDSHFIAEKLRVLLDRYDTRVSELFGTSVNVKVQTPQAKETMQ